ncbi:MAG TPA: L-2-amino-thiazoline-4-carboxylic acid hydrolase, partial [Hyphomicrobiaceae bacterium]
MQIPIIERRRIEAQLLKIIHDELVTRLGEAAAEEIIAESVRKSAIEQGRQFASAEPEGTSMSTFVKLYDLWTMNDALEIDVLHQDAERFDFNVTR